MASRIEQLLEALLNGNTAEIVPRSRKEKYLLALINGEPGVDNPKSRTEAFLYLLAQAGGSGGGGGGDAVTAGIIYDEVDADGNPVKVTVRGESLPQRALYYQKKMTEVYLPNGLKAIGEMAFYYDESLTELNIPDSVESLGASIAYSCKKIVSVHLPTGLTGAIPKESFYGCNDLTNINIPEGITEISQSAFKSCVKMIATLPEGLRIIGNYAFDNCWAMMYGGIVIPASVESIGGSAFNKNSSSSGDPRITITFKGTPTSIASSALSISTSNTNQLVINVPWAEGEVANAPWGATKATINYNYTGE